MNKIIEDEIAHPEHYTKGGLETVNILKAKLTREQLEGFYLGNVIKYITRGQYKNGVKDLKKARVYIDWLIELGEENANS